MSPYLIEELFEQLKRVLSKPIMITDIRGEPYAGANGLSLKNVIFREQPTREKSSIEIEKHPELLAVPLYTEDRLLGLVIIEVAAEDIQTVQIIISMSNLIIQQFLSLHKPRPDAVDLLLTRLVYRPQTLAEGELEQQMAALGYRLDVQRCAVIFELTGFWDNYLQTIGSNAADNRGGHASAASQPLGEKQNLIAAKKRDISQSLISFFSKNQDNVVGYIGNDRFLVLKDLSSTDFQRFSSLFITHYSEVTNILKNIYIKEVTAGLGSPSFSAADLPASVEESLQSLEVGKKLRGPNTAYRSDVLGVLPLILSSHTSQKRDQAGRILIGLTDPELEETLEAFLRHDLNLTQTAEALKVHRNTVIYRLDKIAENVHKDPRRFDDAVELYLALQLRKIFP